MRVSSFDIFDTCVVRKCGAPRNLFDVLSYRVFHEEISDEHRIEFITQRISADESSTFEHLYETFNYFHPFLLPKEEIMQKELECEREMMTPVIPIFEEINRCRNRGDHIIFISDMYLPSVFLRSALSEMGFFKEHDTLYVSGDYGCQKSDGSLYQFIKEREHLSFGQWHHFGDNIISDIQIPNSLGIVTHPVNHSYLPYEQKWIDNSNNITYHIGGIMAGIGRSIYLSTEFSDHNAFAIDISAPLTTAFALRIMTDAEKRGLKRLYFCSRDCFALYHVAKRLGQLTPSVKPIYFHTSREALFNTKEEDLLEYLALIELANKENAVGVVDIRSTGNSLRYLNEVLQRHGFNTVFGYYLEMFCSDSYTECVPPYYCEINKLYCSLFHNQHPILEKFLSLCPERKTTGYQNKELILNETPQDKDYYIENIEELSTINLSILCRYADLVLETELFRHSTEMFYSFVIPTLKQFFSSPQKEYIISLRHLYIQINDYSYIPYIEELPTGIPFKIAQIANISKIRFLRRSMKLIMRIVHIKPLPSFIWWQQGTKVFNSR